MGSYEVAGIKINSVSLKEIFFKDRVLYIAYGFLLLAFIGIVDVFLERYFLVSATAFDAGLHPASREVAQAMKEAVFGNGGEVHREAPWSLYIVNYMYMIYVGSGIIFIVAVAELFDIAQIKKTAVGFLTFGLAMIVAGLFTIMMDLNVFHLHWMFLSPRYNSGMWLMLPLYLVYIPIILFEIYLLLSEHKELAKKMALPILVLSLAVELLEFYVQAKLFDMNSARHLWTTYPLLMLYFMVSAFVASASVMILYMFLIYRNTDRRKCSDLMELIKKITLYSVILLGVYEATAYLFIDKKWASIILFGDFKYYFYSYLILAVAIPFSLLFKQITGSTAKVLASLSIIVGTYLGRMIFVYGGNAYPMSNRFGVGFEKYSEYEPIKEVVFFMPSWGEIAIVVGSIGIVIFIYRVVDRFFSVSVMREH